MSGSEIDNQVANDIEKSVAGKSGVVDFSEIYKELSQLQSSTSADQFTNDLAAINMKLHDDGVLPNLQITGIGSDGTISTKGALDGRSGEVTQSASAVNIDNFQPFHHDGFEHTGAAAIRGDSPPGGGAQHTPPMLEEPGRRGREPAQPNNEGPAPQAPRFGNRPY